MNYLILAIFCSTGNHLLFKSFSRYKVHLLGAVVTNYMVCVLIGLGSSYHFIFIQSPFGQVWMPFAVIQGILLVGCLFLIGWTTTKNGVSVASLSTRLSVTIPTAAAFVLYGDTIILTKVMGILAALIALFLSCVDSNTSTSRAALSFLPVFLFLGFGAHSTLIKYVQENYLGASTYHMYVMFAFMFAFIFSGCVLIGELLRRRQIYRLKELWFGMILGCTNYGSVYFLIQALGVQGWQSSRLFPTIGISVVGLSTFGAAVLFKEKISRRMLTALLVGAISIVVVNF